MSNESKIPWPLRDMAHKEYLDNVLENYDDKIWHRDEKIKTLQEQNKSLAEALKEQCELHAINAEKELKLIGEIERLKKVLEVCKDQRNESSHSRDIADFLDAQLDEILKGEK